MQTHWRYLLFLNGNMDVQASAKLSGHSPSLCLRYECSLLSPYLDCLLFIAEEGHVQNPTELCAALLPQERHVLHHQCDSQGKNRSL